MSADNWAQCPRCTAEGAAELEARGAAIQALYGAAPVDEFDKARRLLAEDTANFAKRSPTFREDYDIDGAEEGTVTVSYRGSCSVCGLSLRFEDSHPIPDWEKRGKR